MVYSPKISPVAGSKAKGKTYGELIRKYNAAMTDGYYGEAELIVYAFMEDRLRSFVFDFREGNQSIVITYGNRAFSVFTYTDGDMPALIALNKLLPYFSEIENQLPSGTKLVYKLFLGDFAANTRIIEITSDNIQAFR